MERLEAILLRLIVFATRPWFWFYENFVQDDRFDDDDLKLIEHELGWKPDVKHHIIVDGRYYGFESVDALKRFMKEYER